ncbi:DinB family protein [Rasiella sp. SM2506]|uniref:DinB family protein n=1 Tax=Rasiella sp. SM2506 TaxID=3423914 RepID=UPI003D7968A9
MKYLFLFLSVFFMANCFAQQITPKQAWLEKWENSKNYLIGIAEVMPEEGYDFKPTERQMSFKEQLVHIQGNIDWLSTSYFTEIGFKNATAETPSTKAETITLITETFDNASKIIASVSEDSLLETVEFFAGSKSKLQILNLLQDHITHHRGQLIVYLNLKDVEPPAYSGW